MNTFTETPQAANNPEILRPPATPIEPATENLVRQLGRISNSESHLSFHAHCQPQMALPLAIAREEIPSTFSYKRVTTPHRPRNRRQTCVQLEKPKLPR